MVSAASMQLIGFIALSDPPRTDRAALISELETLKEELRARELQCVRVLGVVQSDFDRHRDGLIGFCNQLLHQDHPVRITRLLQCGR